MDGKETSNGMNASGLVTSAEAARIVGMSPREFRRAVKRVGMLRKHPASGKFRFLYSRENVLAWIKEEEPDLEGGEA